MSYSFVNLRRCFGIIFELFGSLRHIRRWQLALLAVFVTCLFFSSLFFSYRGFVSAYRYTPEQQDVINYLYSDGQLSDGFGVREREHLLDVKKVMHVIDVLLAVLALLVVGLGWYFYSSKLIGQGFFVGGFFGAIALLLGVIGLFVSFDFVFDLFHRFLFISESWMFPAQSVLIRRFPEVFFASAAKSILMLAFFIQMVFMMIGSYLFRTVEL